MENCYTLREARPNHTNWSSVKNFDHPPHMRMHQNELEWVPRMKGRRFLQAISHHHCVLIVRMHEFWLCWFNKLFSCFSPSLSSRHGATMLNWSMRDVEMKQFHVCCCSAVFMACGWCSLIQVWGVENENDKILNPLFQALNGDIKYHLYCQEYFNSLMYLTKIHCKVFSLSFSCSFNSTSYSLSDFLSPIFNPFFNLLGDHSYLSSQRTEMRIPTWVGRKQFITFYSVSHISIWMLDKNFSFCIMWIIKWRSKWWFENVELLHSHE